ncbi:MAG: hypothetical protein P4M01_02735 [Acidobacteriota bacterium]|nr:hypothetical protein [Acidobacteriota bacterium]
MAVVAGVWAVLATTAGAQAAKRLILTDGSYQSATEFQKQGDRVRYFSAERGEWEELPVSLVDWKATGEWNAGQAGQNSAETLHQVTAEEIAARKEEMLNTPEVAPGLRLPSDGGVFVFEEAQGHSTLVPVLGTKLHEDETDANGRMGGVAKSAHNPAQTIELNGHSAKTRLHAMAPTLYIDIEDENGLIPAANFRLARLERKRDKRLLGGNAPRSGEDALTQRFVRARAEKFSGDWWKIVLLEDLSPGEYALLDYTGGAIQGNLVWDFTVEK